MYILENMQRVMCQNSYKNQNIMIISFKMFDFIKLMKEVSYISILF